MTILVGCDPEIFVTQNNVAVSAHNLIKGDKKNPFKVKNGAVQVDGMALEFNIDPASTDEEFVININSVMDQLKAMVPNHQFLIQPVADFSQEYLDAQPEEAKELGCDPDFDAWNNGMAFEKPDAKLPMRTASGHVHIGWTENADIHDPVHIMKCIAASKQLDFYLGLGSLSYDKDTRRRTMYGKPGCFRPKPYGVEYRTLSNAWLNSPSLMKWVFNNAKLAIESLMDGKRVFGKGCDYVLSRIFAGEEVYQTYAPTIMNNFNIPRPPKC